MMADHPDVFEVVALAAGRNIPLLAYQALQVRPRIVCATGGDGSLADPAELRDEVALAIGADDFTILAGNQELASVATMPEADVVLAASSGRGALTATLAALDAGKDVALANKESLVIAGRWFWSRFAGTVAGSFQLIVSTVRSGSACSVRPWTVCEDWSSRRPEAPFGSGTPIGSVRLAWRTL